MPKQLPENLNEQLINFVSQHPEGAGIDVITEAFRDITSKRSLQRRLAELHASRQIAMDGEARAVRYRPGIQSIQGNVTIGISASGTLTAEIPLSAIGAELQKQVRQPLNARIPVGYRRDFLDSYIPNRSAYLTPEILADLHRMGKTAEGEQPAGTYARNILQRLLVDLAWASSKLEGNTYSLLDTKKLIELGESAVGKDASETQMILNHKHAIEYLVDVSSEEGVSSQILRNLHALLSDNLLPDPAAGGRLRATSVGIGGSVFRPLEVGSLIDECFQQIVATAAAIEEPFEQCFFLMVQLPYLQAFDDVNKRVSRLAANIPLIRHNLCPLSFVDVPDQVYVAGTLSVYELNRIELLRDVFIWAYQRSCQHYVALRQSLGEPDPFRLRYRNELIWVVSDIVRRCAELSAAEVGVTAMPVVPDEHLEHFVRVVMQELASLHEGNYARFRLKPSEFKAWQAYRAQAHSAGTASR